MDNKKSAVTKVGLLAAGHLGNDFYANFLPGMLPFLLANLELSLTAGGLLVMVHSAASSVLQPIFGYVLDRSGKTWPILFTLPGSALFIALAGLMPNLALLSLCIACSGICSAVFHPLGSGILGRITTEGNKGLAMAVFLGTGNFGFAVGPAVVIYCVLQFGMSSLLWLALPGIALSLIYYRMGVHRLKLNQSTQAAPSAGQSPLTGVPWYRSWAVLNLNLVMGLRCWMQVSIITLLPIWLVEQGMSTARAGTLLTVFLVSLAVGGLIGGGVGDRYGHKKFIAAALMLCVPALCIFFSSREITWMSWILIALIGAALHGTMPSSLILAQSLMPDKAAMASGMMLGLSFGLGGLGTALTAAAADHISLHAAMLWTILPFSLAIPLAFRLPAENRQREEQT